MVVVPAGDYMMGSPSSEESRDDDEGPRHRVTISKPFAVGKYEVTRGEFKEFVLDTGIRVGEVVIILRVKGGRNWMRIPGAIRDSHRERMTPLFVSTGKTQRRM